MSNIIKGMKSAEPAANLSLAATFIDFDQIVGKGWKMFFKFC